MPWSNSGALSKRPTIAVLLLILVGLILGGCNVLITAVERWGNPVATPPPFDTQATARALHARLFVADLHADTLLSSRDPRLAARDGHLDLPRLRGGRVGLQVFSIVTNMPFCPGYSDCGRAPNLVALLAVARGWPVETWFSDNARALLLAAKLRAVATDPAAGLLLLRERADLAGLLAEPPATRRIGALLSVEGAQAIGDDVAGLDKLADAGVRMLGLAHFFDNLVAASAHGVSGGGITSFGRQVLQRAHDRGMIVDLAHASSHAIDDFLDGSGAMPFVVSHTGLRGVCDDPRNLDDARAQRIFRAGGLFGVGAWNRVLCLPKQAPAADYIARMVQTILHAVALADREHPGHGDEYVALGSDFDGWVAVGFDASGWPLLTEALMRAGPRLGQAEIARIMGGNVCRLLLRALPGPNPVPPMELCAPG